MLMPDSENQTMKYYRPIHLPMAISSIFAPPRRRRIAPEVEKSILEWCEELLPQVRVKIDEWADPDARRSDHVLVSFVGESRLPLVLCMRADDVRRHHLVKAIAMKESS